MSRDPFNPVRCPGCSLWVEALVEVGMGAFGSILRCPDCAKVGAK